MSLLLPPPPPAPPACASALRAKVAKRGYDISIAPIGAQLAPVSPATIMRTTGRAVLLVRGYDISSLWKATGISPPAIRRSLIARSRFFDLENAELSLTIQLESRRFLHGGTIFL